MVAHSECVIKSREAPPGGGLTMTSYLVGNKASLSRKPCIPDEKLLWNTIMKSWSLFQVKRPLAEDRRLRHIRSAIQPRYLGNHAWLLKLLCITIIKY